MSTKDETDEARNTSEILSYPVADPEVPRSTTSTAEALTEIVTDGESRESRQTLRSSSSIEAARECAHYVNELRGKVGAVVNHDKVQLFIVSLISINAVMMGIATFDFVEDNANISRAFDTVDEIFLIIFTVELCLQFIYHGIKLFLDGWLLFDFIIIVMSWSLDSIQIIRAFRIFRALRLITRIKIMKNLVLALFDVIPRMTAIWGLLGLIFYIFAVMFTQLFSEMEDGKYSYFSRLDNSFFALFQIMTLDAWADVSRELIAEYKYAWLPILMFVIVSAFVVVNLIIAVLCEAISALEGEDKARLLGGDHDGGNDEDSGSMTTNNNAQELLAHELKSLEERLAKMEEMHQQTMRAVAFLTQQLSINNSTKSGQFHITTMDESTCSSLEC